VNLNPVKKYKYPKIGNTPSAATGIEKKENSVEMKNKKAITQHRAIAFFLLQFTKGINLGKTTVCKSLPVRQSSHRQADQATRGRYAGRLDRMKMAYW